MSKDEQDKPPALDISALELWGVKVGSIKIQGLGRVGELLFPRRSAKGKIASAIAARLERGDPLSEFEEGALGDILGLDAKRYANTVRVAERCAGLLPEVQESFKALPEHTVSATTSSEWINKFRRIAEDTEDDKLVDLYARVLAGEITRPGSYSIRTLAVLERLSKEELKLFQRARNLVIGSSSIDYYQNVLTFNEILDLAECGLIMAKTNSTSSYPSLDEGRYLAVIEYGERALVVSRDAVEPPPKFRAYVLTVAGRELCNIPYMAPNEEYLRAFARRLVTKHMAVVRWCQVSDLDGQERPSPDIQIHDFDPPLV